MLHRILLLVSLVALAGCAGPAPVLRLTVSGGEKLMYDMGDNRVTNETQREIKVTVASLTADTAKKEAKYLFNVNMLTDIPPKSVLVEDVNAEKARVLVDDRDPKLNGKVWIGTTALIKGTDPRLGWAIELDESIRAYRVTVVFADGHPVTSHHVTFYSPSIKAKIRKDLGVEK